MSIALVVTRGYSNGTLVGSITDVTRRGYFNDSGTVPPVDDDTGHLGGVEDPRNRLNEAIQEAKSQTKVKRKSVESTVDIDAEIAAMEEYLAMSALRNEEEMILKFEDQLRRKIVKAWMETL